MALVIRVVLFDLDDTLFAHGEAVRRGVAAHRAALGGEIAAASEEAEFERWHALEERHYHRYLAGELGFQQQRRERMRDFAAPYGIDLALDEHADAWYQAYLHHYESAWSLHPDALPVLDALSARGVRVGIITNGEREFQQAKLDGTGLAGRIEHLVPSGEFGSAKPDPSIFLHACALFGVAPAEAAYVGDRLETDALGAAAAGLTGVWIDRHAIATPAERASAAAAGARVIRSLDELPALLGLPA